MRPFRDRSHVLLNFFACGIARVRRGVDFWEFELEIALVYQIQDEFRVGSDQR